jgi:hypothetical protein
MFGAAVGPVDPKGCVVVPGAAPGVAGATEGAPGTLGDVPAGAAADGEEVAPPEDVAPPDEDEPDEPDEPDWAAAVEIPRARIKGVRYSLRIAMSNNSNFGFSGATRQPYQRSAGSLA